MRAGRPPSTARLVWMLGVTAMRRTLRAFRIAQSRPVGRNGRRGATPRKRSGALVALFVLLLPFFLLGPVLFSVRGVHGLIEVATTEPVDATPGEFAVGLAEPDDVWRSRVERNHPLQVWIEPESWPTDATARTRVERGATLLLLVLFGAMFFAMLGAASSDLARVGWTFPWLLTFPVATRAIVTAKVLEYALFQPFSWLMLLPFLGVLFAAAGHGGAAVPYAVVATLALAFLAGALRLWFETWARLRLPVHRVRGLQGIATLIGMTSLFGILLAFSPNTPPQWFVTLIRAAPEWLAVTPFAWPVAVAGGEVASGLIAIVGFGLIVGGVAILGTCRLLRGGVLPPGGGPRGERATRSGWTRPSAWRGILGKEVRLLLRDRNFLVQTIVVPVAMLALQVIVNPGIGRAVEGGGSRWQFVAAYFIGAYAIAPGCFQMLSGEGRALWMLYAFPATLESTLRRKVTLWTAFGLLVALSTIAIFTVRSGAVVDAAFVVDTAFVVAGVSLAGWLAAGIGALGVNPAADHVPRQIKIRYAYLYLFLASSYVAGLQSPDWPPRLAGLLLFATLVFALWLRIRAMLPYLLDPIEAPGPSVSLYDATVAAMSFFGLQTVALLLVLPWRRGRVEDAVTAYHLFLSFAIAGSIVAVLFLLIFRLRGVSLRDELWLRVHSVRRAVSDTVLGAGLGALAGLGATSGYRYMAERGWIELPDAGPAYTRDGLILLAVVAAPICEEILFRGMLFRSLSRALPTRTAVLWSAAVFAVVHPPIAWVPVFLVGVMCAILVARTGFLPAAIAAHAAYNFVVVGN